MFPVVPPDDNPVLIVDGDVSDGSCKHMMTQEVSASTGECCISSEYGKGDLHYAWGLHVLTHQRFDHFLKWAVRDETLFAQRVHFCPLEVKHQCLNPPEKENSEHFIQMCANIR